MGPTQITLATMIGHSLRKTVTDTHIERHLRMASQMRERRNDVFQRDFEAGVS
jgi:hypothetical protein